MAKTNHVLLIEPDQILGKTIASVLEKNGYKVNSVPTAQDGIISADALRPDLVIIELQLVSHSGVEFLYEFRSYSDWDRVPVIIYSAVAPGEFNLSRDNLTKELGVSRYLYKPSTSVGELLRNVKEVLEATKTDKMLGLIDAKS